MTLSKSNSLSINVTILCTIFLYKVSKLRNIFCSQRIILRVLTQISPRHDCVKKKLLFISSESTHHKYRYTWRLIVIYTGSNPIFLGQTYRLSLHHFLVITSYLIMNLESNNLFRTWNLKHKIFLFGMVYDFTHQWNT